MPRTGRLHIEGAYYHVMGRGLERRCIFLGDDDKKDFLERLGIGLKQTDCQCLAFAIMSNHYHLLIRVSNQPLSKLMSKLLSGYATCYNHRKKRSGYVFQNRFKSILCDADNYLLQLIRYIHLNPVKANIIDSLEALDRYCWTGHAALIGQHHYDWYDQNPVLSLFSRQRKTAAKRYREFIQDGIHSREITDLSGGGLVRSYGGWDAIKFLKKEHEVRIGDERILGDSDFVESVLKNDILTINIKTKRQENGWDLNKLVQAVCDYTEVEESVLLQKGRKNAVSLAKSLICYWGIHELEISSTTIASYLNISQPAVSKSTKRGAEYCLLKKLAFDELFGNVLSY